jgi:Ni,Fe-hydrogenase I cytochrome b subunit
MVQISNVTRLFCGIILITVPTIEFGGVFLLKMLRTREPGYMDNPLRQSLFRAGHAHAGVIVILSLICEVLVDSIILPGPLAWIVRIGVPAAAILIPAGFFLSVVPARSDRPNAAIQLAYLGAIVLAISVLILGVGLVRAGAYR